MRNISNGTRFKFYMNMNCVSSANKGGGDLVLSFY